MLWKQGVTGRGAASAGSVWWPRRGFCGGIIWAKVRITRRGQMCEDLGKKNYNERLKNHKRQCAGMGWVQSGENADFVLALKRDCCERERLGERGKDTFSAGSCKWCEATRVLPVLWILHSQMICTWVFTAIVQMHADLENDMDRHWMNYSTSSCSLLWRDGWWHLLTLKVFISEHIGSHPLLDFLVLDCVALLSSGMKRHKTLQKRKNIC